MANHEKLRVLCASVALCWKKNGMLVCFVCIFQTFKTKMNSKYYVDFRDARRQLSRRPSPAFAMPVANSRDARRQLSRCPSTTLATPVAKQTPSDGSTCRRRTDNTWQELGLTRLSRTKFTKFTKFPLASHRKNVLTQSRRATEFTEKKLSL